MANRSIARPQLRPQRRSFLNLMSFLGYETIPEESTTKALPNEILAEILLQVIPVVDMEKLLLWKHRLIPKKAWSRSHPNHVRLNLLLVCRRWAAVIYAFSEFWSTLFIDTSSFRLPRLLRRSIALSENRLLDVYIYPWLWNSESPQAIEVVLLLRTQVHRIRVFYELGRRQRLKRSNHNGKIIEEIFGSSEYSVPNLEHLGLIGPGSVQTHFVAMEWNAPRLHSIYLYPRFSDCCLHDPKVLREIDIVLDIGTMAVSLACLQGCDNLHTLRIRHPRETSPFKAQSRFPWVMHSYMGIPLPDLKVLQFSGRRAVLEQLFHYIQTPQLEKVVFKGMRWPVSAQDSFSAASVLVRNGLVPSLKTLRMEDMSDIPPDHATALLDWPMITYLDMVNCQFGKKFYWQLTEMGDDGIPKICPQLQGLRIVGNLTHGELKAIRNLVDARTRISPSRIDAAPLTFVFIGEHGAFLRPSGWRKLKELSNDHPSIVKSYTTHRVGSRLLQ